MAPDWRALYETAEQFRQLAPWKWMTDADVFGVRDPSTGEVGWCSVMGNAGEFFGLAIYRGDQGYEQFLDIQSGDPKALEDATYGQDAIVVSFCPRREVDKKQLSRIRALGLQPRGGNAWPVFEDHRPGRSPVALTEAEVVFCQAALEQAIVVAKRLQDDPDALDLDEGARMLVRARDPDGAEWIDTWVEEPDQPEDDEPEFAFDEVAVHRAMREAKRVDAYFECDVFPMEAQIDDGESDPYTPAVIMVADAGSGMIVHVQVVHPDEREKATRHELMVTFDRVGGVPAQVAVTRDEVGRALAPLAEALAFELVRAESLPAIEEARDAFAKHAVSGIGPGPKRKPKKR